MYIVMIYITGIIVRFARFWPDYGIYDNGERT